MLGAQGSWPAFGCYDCRHVGELTTIVEKSRERKKLLIEHRPLNLKLHSPGKGLALHTHINKFPVKHGSLHHAVL